MTDPKLLKKALEKNPDAEKLFYRDEDIRWATPKIVADYRAERLKCGTIADIGCGISFQTFSFAKTCKKVYAVEIDKEKIELAKKNASVLGIKNIIFINGDALKKGIIEKIKDSEIIFCDTDRPPEEAERKLKNITPNIDKLLKSYSKITDKMAIEVPPQIHDIDFDCEKEYASLNGSLNRLTLYFGSLKKCERSVVSLPTKEIIFNKKISNLSEKVKIQKIESYIYEVDTAVIKADLTPELIDLTNALPCYQNKYSFLTSKNIIKSPFFKNSFKVIYICGFKESKIIECLKRNHIGKVIIRFEVDPRDYWNVRKNFEKNLSGEKPAYLFNFDDKAVIAEKI